MYEFFFDRYKEFSKIFVCERGNNFRMGVVPKFSDLRENSKVATFRLAIPLIFWMGAKKGPPTEGPFAVLV